MAMTQCVAGLHVLCLRLCVVGLTWLGHGHLLIRLVLGGTLRSGLFALPCILTQCVAGLHVLCLRLCVVGLTWLGHGHLLIRLVLGGTLDTLGHCLG